MVVARTRLIAAPITLPLKAVKGQSHPVEIEAHERIGNRLRKPGIQCRAPRIAEKLLERMRVRERSRKQKLERLLLLVSCGTRRVPPPLARNVRSC